MADNLDHLTALATSLLSSLDGPQRGRLLRRLSMDMRRAQQIRMGQQKAPDGSPWAKRKQRRAPKPAARPVRFLYRSSGQARLVDMRSWVKQGGLMTGYDREAEGIRSFHPDRVVRWLPGQGVALPGAAPKGKRSGSKRLAMFRGMRQGRNLKTGTSADEAWVEFTARAARIARIHHYGLRDRVAPGGPEIDYEERPLLGFSNVDQAVMLNAFIDQAGEALGWGKRAG